MNSFQSNPRTAIGNQIETNPANQEQVGSMYNNSRIQINSPIRTAVKPAFEIGNVTVVLLDKVIVKLLQINEDTLFQQELTDDGVLLRIISRNTEARKISKEDEGN